VRYLNKYKTFEDISVWDEFHTLKSKNPKNPQLVYEREPDTRVLNALIHDLNPGSKILDLGCGDGVDAVYFKSKGFEVTGFDISPVVISELKSKHPNIDWRIYDINTMNIGFEPGYFDLIYCRLSLHYFDRLSITQIISDLRNKLSKNGTLYFTVKTQDFKERVKIGKKFLHKKEWMKILNYYFEDIIVYEHQSKLYNIPSYWLEFECFV